ncbi:hypothetical protein BC332_13169 [Capsicum chinense]|nr:hypothetical protein BC332_13169 [Capsicum chinense]
MATEPATVISTYIHIIRLDTKSGRDFISPCKCRDTSNYVHRECLDQWRAVKLKNQYLEKNCRLMPVGVGGLLPAFCHCPSDVHKKAQALTTLLIPFLKESSFMLENISAALQELVNKNKNVLASDTLSEELIVHQTENENLDLVLEFKCKYSYSKKSAGKNIKALASSSEEWLQALVNVFCESSPAKY